jgi:transcription antitermination factor NusG
MAMAARNVELDDIGPALSEYRKGEVVGYIDPQDGLSAEIIPGVSPRWHVLETHPNSERVVASHLIARRFGFYIPETEHDIVRRGRKLHVTRLMFTGYVFVFVWDILRHASRLATIPGVARIMRHPPDEDGQPGSYVTLTDEMINIVRVEENRKRPLPAVMCTEEITGQKKKKGRWRRRPKTPQELEAGGANEIVCVRTWDAFRDGIGAVDSGTRNQTLLAALGLSSKPLAE